MNLCRWEQNLLGLSTFALRAEIEQAVGNPSWNTGVNHPDLLARCGEQAQVRFLYQQVGHSLEQHLATLRQAPRVAGDRGAVAYLRPCDGRMSGA